MRSRINRDDIPPRAMQAMHTVQRYVDECGLEPALLELITLRASQINGCAFCIDMHTKDARATGETEQRLYGLSAWRDAPYYRDRERAALAWTEAVTLVAQDHVPDEVYEHARQQFAEQELVNLTMAVIAINGWNRLAISLRYPVGNYRALSRRQLSAEAGTLAKRTTA